MEDSGWYQINYNHSQNLDFGKNKGVQFLESDICDTSFKEFCSKDKELSPS